MKYLAITQIILGCAKFWLAYAQPRRRLWHIVSGTVVIGMGFVLLGDHLS